MIFLSCVLFFFPCCRIFNLIEITVDCFDYTKKASQPKSQDTFIFY